MSAIWCQIVTFVNTCIGGGTLPEFYSLCFIIIFLFYFVGVWTNFIGMSKNKSEAEMHDKFVSSLLIFLLAYVCSIVHCVVSWIYVGIDDAYNFNNLIRVTDYMYCVKIFIMIVLFFFYVFYVIDCVKNIKNIHIPLI